MQKKVILITGGSRGLGAACVEKLSSSEDNTVYFTYSGAEENLMPQENMIPVQCDQRDEENVICCVSRVLEEQGAIDVLVNNACPSFRPCDILTADWPMFQDLIDVNVKGAFWFTKEAAKAMKRQGCGKIVNIISSYVINIPPEKLSFYVTAKYALVGLSKASCVELSKYGITVNMISPGMMPTQLTSYLPARYFEAYRQKHPMKRITETEDVAEVLEFLVSDNSRFLNGVNIPVNGGESF